jgi:hypothetical protein
MGAMDNMVGLDFSLRFEMTAGSVISTEGRNLDLSISSMKSALSIAYRAARVRSIPAPVLDTGPVATLLPLNQLSSGSPMYPILQ